MVKLKIEKLHQKGKLQLWVKTHAKFCRIGDIVRLNRNDEAIYEVISDPIWSDSAKDWDIKLRPCWDIIRKAKNGNLIVG